MTPVRTSTFVFLISSTVLAQPALVEPPEFPQIQPGPQAVYAGEECFLLAAGIITPGDVDWVRVRLPQSSSRTVIDVDFPNGASGSALLAFVTNGVSGFNIADNNNSRDALCGLDATSSPPGSPRDSVVDLQATSFNAQVNIGVTGAADTSFIGLHTEHFAYEVWVYALPIPCTDDASCDDEIACTLDHCNVASGICSNQPQNDECDDGVFCDGVERCTEGVGCQNGTPPNCNDNVECTEDICHAGADECRNVVSHYDCDNGLFCDGDELCDPEVGCVAGEPVVCDDFMDCTADACDEENWGCSFTADDAACDDGEFCNGQESCDIDYGCVAGPAPCPSSECRESDDRCVNCMADSDCDDGVFCNGQEQCNSLGLCTSGGYPCGQSMCRESDDRCVECLGNGDCTDGQYCNGVESCTTDGQCEDGSNPCGSGLCRESDDRCVECLRDDDCDDGVYCNGAETCNAAGVCANGSHPCGESMCREADDRCVDCLADADCGDEEFCNGVEQCDSDGMCASGSDPCDPDLCRESDDQCVQCLSAADCNDGKFCNGVEKCDASGDCVSGAPPCSDGQTCNETADTCVGAGFTVNIRPGACPARVMTTARGYLPVAIVGVDVRKVAPNSVRLARLDGVGKPVDAEKEQSGQGPRFRDVSGPSQPCVCPSSGPDGREDLVVSFGLEEVVKAMRFAKLPSGTKVQLQVTGKLRNGKAFSATDCVIVQPAGVNGTGSTK